jgi:hypothetical protein
MFALLLSLGFVSSAIAAPEIYKGEVPDLSVQTLIRSVVRLEMQFSAVDNGLCSGVFISDRTLISSAHCFSRDLTLHPCRDTATCTPYPQSVTLYLPQPGGSFVVLEDLAFAVSWDEKLDLALAHFPSGTFTGQPMAFEVYSEKLQNELIGPGVRFVTYGYGRTENRERGVLHSSDMPAVEFNSRLFLTRDRIRLMYGDSGGPVVAYRPGQPPTVVAINQGTYVNIPNQQKFVPLSPLFFKRYPGTVSW